MKLEERKCTAKVNKEARVIIKIKHHGNFSRTERFFMKISDKYYLRILEKYGKEGVEALANSTPKDTGKTANSWSYKIVETPNGHTIYWENSNVVNHVNIAVILQYGHGTRNGGYVQGIDYINPALQPIFKNIANEAWKEVTSV
jgi:hypothetical protein